MLLAIHLRHVVSRIAVSAWSLLTPIQSMMSHWTDFTFAEADLAFISDLSLLWFTECLRADITVLD